MSVKQISIFLENKSGALNKMTSVLADAGIDMRALSMAETKDFGIVRIIVDDVIEASSTLKAAGFVCTLTPVVVCAIPDEPGGLNKILQVLTEAQVNIEYMYAFLGGKDADHAYMIFRVDNEDVASAILVSNKFHVVEQEEISEL